VKFGIFNLMESPRGKEYARHEQEIAEQAAYAEELGFDSIWLAEHHFDRDYGLCPSTMMYAVKLGQVTRTIKIGSLVVILPLSHPLKVAAEAAFADVLTRGRLWLGLGSGYAPYEFEGFGVPIDDRRQRFQEALAVVRRALSGQPFSHSGEYYRFPELTVFPSPIQQPLPLLLTANSPGTAAFVGRQGIPLALSGSSLPLAVLRQNFELYRQAYGEAGHGGAPLCALNRMVYVADSDQQARRDAEAGTLGYLHRQARVFNAGKMVDESTITYERFLGDMFSHGSPETVSENIERLRQACGLDYMMCKFYVNGLSHEQIMRTMKLFAAEVMPRFPASEAAAVGG
jgi:alkanesulfonate monooxygenase SsuD/methylene tetrahydromethanopterin reductase-like flavin-dependent oxidoreductase (luciferase family)